MRPKTIHSGLFKKVLIANRGEIALRVMRALQSLEIKSLAIYHACEWQSPIVKQADEAAEIFADNPAAAYLDIDQIVDLCRQYGADALHPG
mgnify:CR=1 FL=1